MSNLNAPKHGYTISHTVILQVINYKDHTYRIYRVTTYKMLDFLMDLANRFTKYGSRKIPEVDPESEEALAKYMQTPWDHGLRETEKFNNSDEWFVLEMGKKK